MKQPAGNPAQRRCEFCGRQVNVYQRLKYHPHAFGHVIGKELALRQHRVPDSTERCTGSNNPVGCKPWADR